MTRCTARAKLCSGNELLNRDSFATSEANKQLASRCCGEHLRPGGYLDPKPSSGRVRKRPAASVLERTCNYRLILAGLLICALTLVCLLNVEAAPQNTAAGGSASESGASVRARNNMQDPVQTTDTLTRKSGVHITLAKREQHAHGRLVLKELKARSFSVATYQSLGMILVTELGDKTFFIAAVLAARHSRFTVLQGALGALVIMTVLSALLGRTFPTLFSPQYTSILAGVLFVYFGVQMLRDYWRLCQKRNRAGGEIDTESNDGSTTCEVAAEGANGSEFDLQALEEKLSRDRERPSWTPGDDGRPLPDPGTRTEQSSMPGPSTWLNIARDKIRVIETLAQMCFSPLFLRAFTLTFLAEWGDRSQIATIALAAHRNIHGVVLGAVLGHLLCTGLAVVGGRLVAHKIPERFIALCGGILFILFGVLSFANDHDDA
jgi:putative Ca2+/H+ antiporter (TMEM165/GDT1 family)